MTEKTERKKDMSEESETVLLVQCDSRHSQGNTSTSINLFVALTMSISLGGQELL